MRLRLILAIPLVVLVLSDARPVAAEPEAEVDLVAGAAMSARAQLSLLEPSPQRAGVLEAFLETMRAASGIRSLKEQGIDGDRDALFSLIFLGTENVGKLLDAAVPPASAQDQLAQPVLRAVVPYVDENAITRSALHLLSAQGTWVKRDGDPRRTKAFLGQLRTEAERAAARSTAADYVIARQGAFAALWLHRPTQTLELQVAPSLAAATDRFSRASADELEWLQSAGFFRGGFAFELRPQAIVELGQYVTLTRTLAAISGADPATRSQLWRAGISEAKALERLVTSPKLFRSLLLNERSASWGLSSAGMTALAGVQVRDRFEAGNLLRLAQALRKRLPLEPLLARSISEMIRTNGSWSLWPVFAFWWPYLLGTQLEGAPGQALARLSGELQGQLSAIRVDRGNRRLVARFVPAAGTAGQAREPKAMVRFGQPVIQGGLSPSGVVRTLRLGTSAIASCYQRALKRAPGLNGTITLTLYTDALGRVVHDDILSDTIGENSLASCVRNYAARWRFPGPEHVQGAVTIPVTLRSAP